MSTLIALFRLWRWKPNNEYKRKQENHNFTVMSLKTGAWKMNENGIESTLTINNVEATGEVSGSIFALLGAVPEEFSGLWDETSRTITLSGPFPLNPPPGTISPIPRFYKGFLFSTPRHPTPGQDVVWTLVGFVQAADLATAVQYGGNARRNIFGWFAQITEVA